MGSLSGGAAKPGPGGSDDIELALAATEVRLVRLI